MTRYWRRPAQASRSSNRSRSPRLSRSQTARRARRTNRPVSRAACNSNEATLTWNTVAGADSYELSIKSGEEWITIDPAEFLEKYRLTVVVGDGTATMSTLYDSRYEFRVRAVNDNGASEWSEAATVEY